MVRGSRVRARGCERLGLEVVPYVEATEITADNVNALFPERQKLKGPKAIEFDADVFFARPVRAQFRDIRAARERFPFDALLIDGAFYAGYLVAKRLGCAGVRDGIDRRARAFAERTRSPRSSDCGRRGRSSAAS